MNPKSIKSVGLNILFSLLLLFPILTFAQATQPTGVVQSTGGTIFGITYECPTKVVGGVTVHGECDFDDLIAAVLFLVNWATGFALGFSVIVIAYAGFKYMRSGDNPGERKAANSMLTKVVIGICFIIGAWLIVRLITSGLGVNTGVINFNP